MTKMRFIVGSLAALATGLAAAAPVARAADEWQSQTRILDYFNATANSAIPVTGVRAPADSTSANANLARDWISVVATFSSVLQATENGTLEQCATLRITPEDARQLVPLKSLHLPISIGDASLADILQPQAGPGLVYGTCVPYETRLTPVQRRMVMDRDWDGLAASGLAISRKGAIRIMDAANQGVLQEVEIESIADPARDARLLRDVPVQDMPSAYTLKPVP
jgi:hypothetical protein